MYLILIEILKNALFLQPLYFESNFEKCREDLKSARPQLLNFTVGYDGRHASYSSISSHFPRG